MQIREKPITAYVVGLNTRQEYVVLSFDNEVDIWVGHSACCHQVNISTELARIMEQSDLIRINSTTGINAPVVEGEVLTANSNLIFHLNK